MLRIAVSITNIVDVLLVYNQLKLYSSSTEAGTYTEVTAARANIDISTTFYWLTDPNGSDSLWYKTSYYNSLTAAESAQSAAVHGSAQQGPVGWSFDNYSAIPGEWGDILTPDDLRYTYLYGIETSAENQTALSDTQLRFLANQAMGDFEKTLDICIRRRKYVTAPSLSLKRAQVWRSGVDYTDEEDPYDFDPQLWGAYGFLPLRHKPVLSVQAAMLMTATNDRLMDLLAQGWVRVNKNSGQLNFYPQSGITYGPFSVYGSIYRMATGIVYPQGFRIDYEAGFESAAFVPADLREVIAKMASIKLLCILSDAQFPGIASRSVSLDGLSESSSLTKSSNSLLYGARIKQYTDDITEWMQKNKFKYKAPIGFVGSV